MSNPTQRQLHVDRPLTEISIAYMLDKKNLVADKIFPIVPVKNKTDEYFVYNQDDFRRISAGERAPGTESNQSGYNITTDSYVTKRYAVNRAIPQVDIDNADSPLDPLKDGVEYVTEQLLLLRESIFMESYFKAGVWSTELQGVGAAPTAGQFLQWDDTGSTPILDIKNQKNIILKKTNFEPNVLLVGPEVFDALVEHPTIADKIKYTQTGIVTEDLLAKMLGLEKVIVAKASYNTAAKGATAVDTFFAGKNALLAYAPARASLRNPSAGYVFSFKDASGYNINIKRWFENRLDSHVIEAEMDFACKKVSDLMGIFFKDAVA